MRRTLSTLYLAFALAGLMISPAAAETPDEEDARHETARIAGEAGLKLYSSTRWDEAFEAFQRAESAFHAPTLVLYMGHCKRMRGKLIDARALYQQVIDETLGPSAPNQFLTAQLLARGELDRVRRRIPAVMFTIKGARADLVRVTVDGAPLTVSPGIAPDLDPGEHALTATAPGAAPIQRKITLNEGAAMEVPLAFEARPDAPTKGDPTAPAAPSIPPSAAADSPAPSSTTAPQTTPAPSMFQGVPASAWIAFGAGAAGLGVGAVTGAIAIDRAGDIKGRCSPLKHCPATDQASADAAGRVADASTTAFLLGGAGVITGVVLWLVLPANKAAARAEASRVRFNVGPGLMTLEGAF